MRSIKLKKILFIVIDIILFGTIVFNIFTSKIDFDTDCLIRFLATFFLCLFSILTISKNATNGVALAFSTMFSFFADYFLLFKNEYNSAGILLFILTQACFYAYINDLNFKKFSVFFIVIIGSFIIGSLLLLIFKEFNYFESIVALIYISVSILNLVMCFINKRKFDFITISILLLLICDINIGLDNITNIDLFNKLEWIFYVPSQFMLYLEISKSERLLLEGNK